MRENQYKLSEIISYLEKVIEDKKKPKKKSYTSDLLSQGIDRISQKVGEEAVEVVIASNNKKKKLVIYESADLVFHLLILWAKLNIKTNDIEMFSKKAVYDKKKSTIELFDNVLIKRGNEIISGDYGIINTAKSSYKVSSNNSKKVKAIIVGTDE